ncbi:MAG TPA: carbohydrate binding family 9 domain-containing protein, partial [Gammaproteobacteria bacterium]|nr:carbohydrate binding family 9 domain-containing protein [Gammaproteobacteria bacterium]
MIAKYFGLALTVVCAAQQAGAQETAPPRDPGQKSVHMVRTATPPVIDGALDEAIWAMAAVIDDLHQVNPLEYAAPSERTEIRLLYDDDALYVGAKLYDSQPENITANMLRQNGGITSDDTIFVTLDPFNTRRSGYFFGVNANAVRLDGLYRNVSEYYSDWDTIYYVQTSRFEGGWIAEYEIPFKSISFDPKVDTWGLNFSRSLERRNEDMAWVTRNRRWDPSSAGLAIGFEGLEQGVGLDVVPSASLRNTRTFATSAADSSFEPSLDLVYKLTPALNGSLTFNTDFSATEVDDRQVNLTRFGLFFPEKRDFFLREADIFEFGRIGAQDGNGAISGAERQNGRPFFSRRIGLGAAGELVDLEYGGKVSGRVGRWEIGALSIHEDENAGVDAATLSVVRAKAGIGAESTLGMIATNGDPLSNRDNSLAGVDFLYRNSRLPGGRTLEAGAWYQQSDTEDLVGEDSAAGIGLSIPSNARFRGGIAVKEFQANFNPALGFISRRGVRDYSGHIAYTHRPPEGYWQSIYFALDAQRI